MSKLLPYEEQWLSMQADIRLPDEDMAWADMKQRLEENKRRSFIWWRWGCLGWGIVLGILLAGGIIWFVVNKRTHAPDKAGNNGLKKILLTDSAIADKHTSVNRVNNTIIVTKDTANNAKDTIIVPPPVKESIAQNPVIKSIKNNSNKIAGIKITLRSTPKINGNGNSVNGGSNMDTDNKLKNETVSGAITSLTDSIIPDKIETVTDTAGPVKQEKHTTKRDSIQSTQENENKVNKYTNSVYFTAGAGLQQLIPLQGQQLTPYNASGRKGSLGDYIPAVFFKMHYGEKWFLQTEFRYGAPQTTKSFIYKEINVPDTGIAPAFNMISSTQLRKTFYHQLPVTLNYSFNKQFSIGLGIQVNRFQAAIGEQSVVKHDNTTQADTLVSKRMFAEKNAAQSGFAKTYLLGVGELQYQWRHFFIGVKYTYGLQPYIRFTIQGQGEQKESSRSLQIMLRYQFWKSK